MYHIDSLLLLFVLLYFKLLGGLELPFLLFVSLFFLMIIVAQLRRNTLLSNKMLKSDMKVLHIKNRICLANTRYSLGKLFFVGN